MSRILLFFLCLLPIGPAVCQIANIESKRKDTREEGLSGSLDLSFSYVKNVDEVLQYGGNISAYYFKGRHSVLLLLESALIQAEEQNLVHNNFEHLRYNFRLGSSRRVILEAFQQLQQNRVQDIRLRLLTGTGLRFKFVNDDSLQMNAGITGMYEYEVADEANLTESHIRGSSYVSMNYWLTKNVNMNFIGYYQPVIKQFNDYRVSSELNIKSVITKRLAFKTRINVIYDSQPLPGIPNAIINISNGLSITL